MRVPMRARSAARAGVVVAVATGTALTAAQAAHAVPETRFQMPFPCGEEWTGSTRSSHSPSSRAIDFNRLDDEGDPVVASAPGVVSVADAVDNGGYGRWVRVTHPSGESTIYAHLQSVAVKVGQTVDQATLLGLLGTSGNSSGPHLHFEERDSAGVMVPYFDGAQYHYGTTTSANCVDVPVAGNFLGRAPAEVAVFRRTSPAAFIIRRPDREPKVVPFGAPTDQPVVGDWDGNGTANPGVRTPGTKTFLMRTPAGLSSLVFGRVTDLPIAGDWDGDGLWEVGVRRPAVARFVMRAADGSVTRAYLGDPDDLPVTGDWNGDARTDLGVYDVDTATFTLRLVDQDGLAWTAQVPFGQPGDLPVTGDWDGNGRTDLGVWDPATAAFSQRRSPAPTSGTVRAVRSIVFGDPR